jgi:hypothetical protein
LPNPTIAGGDNRILAVVKSGINGGVGINAQVDKGVYVESKWRDPADTKSVVLIDVQPGSGSSVQADAGSVRAQTSTTPGYREISFEPALVAGVQRLEMGVRN